MKTYYSNGKLLITGEYAVLNGALSFALPTKYGQELHVNETDNKECLTWISTDETGTEWFSASFSIPHLSIIHTTEESIANRLLQVLKAAKDLNPFFLGRGKGYHCIAQVNFPRNWGLGSSSTLLNNIAQWARVNAFALSNLTFGGSGYDIACAQNNTPIYYQIKDELPTVTPVSFKPNFLESLNFVHLNKKQNSRDEISRYKKREVDQNVFTTEITKISLQLLTSTTLESFTTLLNKHELIVAKALGAPTIKESLFPDFNGSIKSLGAWGGDFILVIGETTYFKNKGYTTIIPFNKMILKTEN